MKLPATASGLAAALTLLAAPAPAGAQYVVPPGNSAVNQYTETIPTSGGGRDSDGGSGKRAARTPAHVLGKRKADKLEAQGPAGRAAAATAAVTAPIETAPAGSGSPTPNSRDDGGGAGRDNSRASSDSGSRGDPTGRAENPVPVARTELPDGSSGLAEVLAQATGSTSSGQTGLLLPLVILAALAWAFGFAWKQRQHVG